MKTIEERANEFGNDKTFALPKKQCACLTFGYLHGAIEQRQIDETALVEIYDLYSALIDDLYCGYRLSDYNGGIVDVFEETISMGEALDKLNAVFNKALFPKSAEQ